MTVQKRLIGFGMHTIKRRDHAQIPKPLFLKNTLKSEKSNSIFEFLAWPDVIYFRREQS